MIVATFESVAAEIRSLPPCAGATRVTAVDGPAGAGKTTFAGRLAAELGAAVVHVDDLCPGWTGLSAVSGRVVEWILSPLAAHQIARYRRYDWERDEYAEWHDVPAVHDLVLEGVMSASRAAAPYLSFVVWVIAPVPVRLERGVARDGEAYRARWLHWISEEDILFQREQPLRRAGLVVDGAPRSSLVDGTFAAIPMNVRDGPDRDA